MDKMSEIVDRVGQLRVLASDITKNDSDISNYSKEFLELQGKMDNAAETKLNGVDLFVFQQQSLSSKIKSAPATHTNEDGSIENYLKYSLNLETETYQERRYIYQCECGQYAFYSYTDHNCY